MALGVELDDDFDHDFDRPDEDYGLFDEIY